MSSTTSLFEQCPNELKEWCKELKHPCSETCLKSWQEKQDKMIEKWAHHLTVEIWREV